MRIGRIACAAIVVCTTAVSAKEMPAPLGCTTPQSHQFDFWVGSWKVFRKGEDKKIANSEIEKLYAGCAIRENWMPRSLHLGGSLSTYVPQTKAWRQFWVDSDGAAVDFTGGWNGKAMILQGVWPQAGKPRQITRMTLTPSKDGSVEQLGETSDDGGKTWQPSFDFVYRPAVRYP
jgi:hypothetical protein